MSAIDEKTKAERALKDLQKVQGEERVLLKSFIFILFSFPSSCCISIFAFIMFLLTWTLKWYVSD